MKELEDAKVKETEDAASTCLKKNLPLGMLNNILQFDIFILFSLSSSNASISLSLRVTFFLTAKKKNVTLF